MCTSAPSHPGWAAGSGASCGGQPRPAATASRDGGHLCCAVLGSSAGRKHGTSGAGPRPHCAKSRTTTQRARTLGVAAGSDHIGNLQSIQPSTTIGVLPPTSTPHMVGPALEYYSQYCQHSAMMGLTLEVSTAPYPTLAGGVHASGTSSAPLRWPTQPKRTHAQATPRRTLSFTIASQTIVSSPDGSETSSAASSACGIPAATAGGGCQFRASSTVASSSSPYNNTLAR